MRHFLSISEVIYHYFQEVTFKPWNSVPARRLRSPTPCSCFQKHIGLLGLKLHMKKLTPSCNLVNKIGSSEGHRAGSLQLVREAQNPQCLVFGVSQHMPFPAGQRGGTAHAGADASPTAPALPSPPHCSSLQPSASPTGGALLQYYKLHLSVVEIFATSDKEN